MFKPLEKNKNIFISLLITLIVIVLYLNRAYAHIYQTIENAHLAPVKSMKNQIINSDASATSSLTYLSLGDSLMAGVGTRQKSDSLPYLLALKMATTKKRVVLHNYAVPGYKTNDLIDKLLSIAINTKPQIVTVLIGVNDIHAQVSLNTFRHNYNYILNQLKHKTKAKIYLISIPFIGARTMMLPPYQSYFDFQTKRFNLIIKELADKYKVNYVDLYGPTVDLFKKTGPQYSADLFHPSALGYRIWAQKIYDYICK